MLETEITADLTKENYQKYIDKFTKELGYAKIVHRISFMIMQQGTNLDTRIKITNGKARIVQKIKQKPNNKGMRLNEEIEIDIPDDVDSVLSSIRLINNYYSTFEIKPLKLIIQHESHIWDTDEFELKIARQFGKSDIFVYEIESKTNKDPEEIEKTLGITPDYDAFSDERQTLRREFGDLKYDELSEGQIVELIKKYLS
jgi:hypothetical protein